MRCGEGSRDNNSFNRGVKSTCHSARNHRACSSANSDNVTVNFAEGQVRGTGRGQASAYVDRAASTLPADIQERITRTRKAGDQDAAVDPLSLPEVRAAVQRSSFELLVGFQLTQDQLEYNGRR